MMPGATNRLADDEPIGKRRAIMGAHRADCKNIFATPGEQHGLAVCVAGQHAAVRKIAERYSLPQVRPGWCGGIRSHAWPPSCCYVPAPEQFVRRDSGFSDRRPPGAMVP